MGHGLEGRDKIKREVETGVRGLEERTKRMGLVVSDTPGELAAAIKLLAKDEKLRLQMGEKARRRALEEFCPERQAEAVEKIYRQCLNA